MTDTICAPATAPGGALAVIRVSGPKAFPIVSSLVVGEASKLCSPVVGEASKLCSPVVGEASKLCRPAVGEASKLCSPAVGEASKLCSPVVGEASKLCSSPSVRYTHIAAQGELIDDIVLTLFRAPRSYTGEDTAEISCHGSPYIKQRILALLVEQGCRMARPGEFTQRAFLHGKLDLSQAEAVADLIAATDKATHDIAMSQLRGGISTELSQLRDHLLHLTSLLELELDFSDHEDLEFADRTELLQLAQTIEAHIARLARSFETGNALKNGVSVAIIGAPNVGKSTLLNALLGEERAIVSDIQGTTRDAIEDTINLHGVTFRFIDTAGIRHTSDTIEQIGIERSIAAAQRARIILLMSEPGIPYPDIPVRSDQTVIRIENKTKAFQAKYGVGIDELKQQLIAAIPTFCDTDVVVTNARHYDALQRAHASILRVIEGLNDGLSGDLLSEDLRQTLDILAEITGGQITPQETLNNIFSHFCVGK